MITPKKWHSTFLIVLFLALPFVLTAQEMYSLDDCFNLALEKNDKLKIANTDSEIANIHFKQSKERFVPSIGISNQHNISVGRVLDPTTYDFVENKAVYDMNAALVGSITLFSGLDRYHNIGKARLNTISTQLSAKEVELELKMDVTTLFYQILLDKETISICESKISMLGRQKELILKRIEYKAAVPADLLNVQADITNAKVDLTDAFSNLHSDIVSLCSILDIDDWTTFDIATTDLDTIEKIVPELLLSDNLDGIVSNLPSVRQSQVISEIAMTDVKIASSSFWPTIRLDAGFGTSFSNARYKFDGTDYSFAEQFQDNMNSYLSMTLSVPISSITSTSKAVREKKLNYNRSMINYEDNKNAWTKKIKQAIVQGQSAYSIQKLLSDNVSIFEEALNNVEKKYDLGVATYYDYQTAINDLFNAQIKESQAIFDYQLKIKIIELLITQYN